MSSRDAFFMEQKVHDKLETVTKSIAERDNRYKNDRGHSKIKYSSKIL